MARIQSDVGIQADSTGHQCQVCIAPNSRDLKVAETLLAKSELTIGFEPAVDSPLGVPLAYQSSKRTCSSTASPSIARHWLDSGERKPVVSRALIIRSISNKIVAK